MLRQEAFDLRYTAETGCSGAVAPVRSRPQGTAGPSVAVVLPEPQELMGRRLDHHLNHQLVAISSL